MYFIAAKSRLRTGEIAGGDNRVTVGVIVVGLTTITLIICLAKLSKNTGKEPHKRQDRGKIALLCTCTSLLL